MIEKYLPRIQFDSYEDFKQNYRVNVPEKFNFAFDVVDEWAKLEPNKLALVWIDDDFHEKRLTFSDLKDLSNRAANVFAAHGIRKGDYVLLMLKQRIEAWVCILALHKLGAVVIPASFQLTEKDIIYRCNAANVQMVVGTDDPDIVKHLNLSKDSCPTVKAFAMVSDQTYDGYLDFRIREGSFPQNVRPHAGVLLLGYDRHAEDGPSRPVLGSRPHHDGQILAAGRGGRTASDGL